MRTLSSADEHIRSLRRELKHIQVQARFLEWAAAARALHRSLRDYEEVVRRYSPDQPRIPAGQTGGGRWTSGEGGDVLEGGDGQPREMTQPRRPLARQYPGASHSQLAQLAAAQAQARAAVAEARIRDPKYWPTAGAYESIEGEIMHHRAVEAEARAHFGGAAASEGAAAARGVTPGTPSAEIVAPGGVRVGSLTRSSWNYIRTVDADTFDTLLGRLSIGARPWDSGADCPGAIFQRPDGFRYGVRWSEGAGWTIDIMSQHRDILRLGKIHQR